MQSLKGEPRHYAVAAVHGPLPYHPFDSSSSPVCFSLPPSALLIARPLSVSLLFSSPPRSSGGPISLFLFHRGESFATVYTYPNGIRHSLDSEPIQ